MKSFDEWFDDQDDVGCMLGLEGHASQKAWDYQQQRIDELQKRIDGAHRELKYINSSIWEETVTDTINILKGQN
jgi:ABC-type Fe3+-hydroxamate transport system substrate-binding protein